MPLNLFYITNNPEVALIAQKYGVNRIWIDLETLGKEERQKNINSVKSHHSVNDISIIKPLLSKSELLVRINPWNVNSNKEIDSVINAGADIIMLPYWKSAEEVSKFLNSVNRRAKTTLLLETKEAVECVDEVLKLDFDEIHIGLNDLHLSYGLTFMFELLANGTVESLCDKFKLKDIPYGFGGIGKPGDGLLPAEKIILEHYRLGSTRAILSRTFCNYENMNDINEIDILFRNNMQILRSYESSILNISVQEFNLNKIEVIEKVNEIVDKLRR